MALFGKRAISALAFNCRGGGCRGGHRGDGEGAERSRERPEARRGDEVIDIAQDFRDVQVTVQARQRGVPDAWEKMGLGARHTTADEDALGANVAIKLWASCARA